MHRQPRSHERLGSGEALDKRLKKMVAAGRLSEDEASRMRAATTPEEREVVARTVQLRHARGRIDEALENGRLTQQEAEAYIERLDNGEDVSIVRSVRRRFRNN